MNSLLKLLPLNIWEIISLYCFNEFRLLNKETYNISLINYPNIMRIINIKRKINNKYSKTIPLSMIKNLLNYGVYDIDEDINKFNWTFLYWSCRNNDIKSVKYLIENNANIYKCDSWKNTPLNEACCENNIDIVKCLIDKSRYNYENGTTKLSVKEYIDMMNVYQYNAIHIIRERKYKEIEDYILLNLSLF